MMKFHLFEWGFVLLAKLGIDLAESVTRDKGQVTSYK